MLLLIPVSRFKVRYHVAAGRPFSAFERLVLESIYDGAETVEELVEEFCVHPRLLLEALVTLTQAGWLAVGGAEGAGFTVTSSGKSAVTSGNPPRSRSIYARTGWLILERLTGAIANEASTSYIQSADLRALSTPVRFLEEGFTYAALSEAQVEPFLPRAKTEWLHRIDYIQEFSRQSHWIPISITDCSIVLGEGLPDDWIGRLTPILTSALSSGGGGGVSTSGDLSGNAPSRLRRSNVSRIESELPEISRPLCVKQSDFLFSDEEHRIYLQTSIERATEAVLISSAFLRLGAIRELEPVLLEALSRGVNIDLIWGYNASLDALDALSELAEKARARLYLGKLRVNKTPSTSHAKLLLSKSDDALEACVGSFNWLSAAGGSNLSSSTNASICVRDNILGARLARVAAELWDGIEKFGGPSQRWKRIAANLGEMSINAVEPTDSVGGWNASASVLLDFDHGQALRSWLAAARTRLLIASHRLGIAAENRMLVDGPKHRLPSFSLKVIYGQNDLDVSATTEFHSLLSEFPGVAKQIPGLHAKAVVSDAIACVGSFNFLSTDAFSESAGGKEISLVLQGERVADFLYDRLAALSES